MGKKAGFALVAVLGFAAILSILIAGLMIASATHLKQAGSQIDREKALYVARAARSEPPHSSRTGARRQLPFQGP